MFKVSKEEFVKKYMGRLTKKYPENSGVYKILKEDAEGLYEQVTDGILVKGIILVDEEKLREAKSQAEMLIAASRYFNSAREIFWHGYLKAIKEVLGEV